MQIQFSSGNFDIVSHGQTFLYSESDLRISIGADNHFSFCIVMNFTKDDSKEGYHIDAKTNDNTISLNCINFQDDGTGFFQPIEVATINNRKLYFAMWSVMQGDKKGKIRSVMYTFFYEKAKGEQ